MAFANVFMALRDDADALVRTYLRHDEEADGEYSGPVTSRAGRLFRFLADEEVVSNLWLVPNVGGRDYHLYSISFNDDQYSLSQIRDEIDWLITTYDTQAFVLGAWKWTGEQYGTQWTDENRTSTTGTPIYPIPAAQLLSFMPDIDGNPATVLADINLLQGQSPRDFSV